MAEKYDAGVYQQENGQWAYRFSILIDGKRIARKKTTDEYGNKLTSQRAAAKARAAAIANAYLEVQRKKPVARRTVEEVFKEYCETGRKDRKYQTIRKQDNLWENHLCARFGKRYIDDISAAEIGDYISKLTFSNNVVKRRITTICANSSQPITEIVFLPASVNYIFSRIILFYNKFVMLYRLL